MAKAKASVRARYMAEESPEKMRNSPPKKNKSNNSMAMSKIMKARMEKEMGRTA